MVSQHAPVVSLDGVSYSYGESIVLHQVSMEVTRGDFAAIVGPNGSGKSTLIKIVLGLLRPSTGRSKLFGVPIGNFSEWHRVGYVPQISSGMNQRLPMTVREVVFQGLYRGFAPWSFWRKRGNPEVEQALQTVGILQLSGRRIGELSTGQQQRVLVARALVRDPDLLVLDEPIGGVDVEGEEQLYATLRSLNERALTVLMVSHDIGAVIREAKTVACINQTLMFHGQPHELTKEELSRLYGYPVEVLLHDALHEHR